MTTRASHKLVKKRMPPSLNNFPKAFKNADFIASINVLCMIMNESVIPETETDIRSYKAFVLKTSAIAPRVAEI